MSKYSIGIMAFNEELNIKTLLESISNQTLSASSIDEIIVVSSGSIDNTEKVIEGFSKINNNVKLLTQKERMGKASAINLFLQNAKNESCILVNGDCTLDRSAFERLDESFRNGCAGMVGSRPIPRSSTDTFIHSVISFMWELHHRISLIRPKMSEMIVFKKSIIRQIPEDIVVDEVYMEAAMKANGYRLVYVPDAIVYIEIPDTIRDFVKQRRRNITGHLWAKRRLNYIPSTENLWLVIKLTLKQLTCNPRHILLTGGTIFLEGLSRILGAYDFYIRRRIPYVW